MESAQMLGRRDRSVMQRVSAEGSAHGRYARRQQYLPKPRAAIVSVPIMMANDTYISQCRLPTSSEQKNLQAPTKPSNDVSLGALFSCHGVGIGWGSAETRTRRDPGPTWYHLEIISLTPMKMRTNPTPVSKSGHSMFQVLDMTT